MVLSLAIAMGAGVRLAGWSFDNADPESQISTTVLSSFDKLSYS